MNGGTLGFTGTSSGTPLSSNVTITAGDTATFAPNGTQYYSGTLSGGGTLDINAGGTFFFYAGTVSSGFSGTIEFGSSNATVDRSGGTAGANYGTGLFDLGTGSVLLENRLGSTYTMGALQGSSGSTITGATTASAGTTIYSIGAAGLSTTYAGKITSRQRLSRGSNRPHTYWRPTDFNRWQQHLFRPNHHFSAERCRSVTVSSNTGSIGTGSVD